MSQLRSLAGPPADDYIHAMLRWSAWVCALLLLLAFAPMANAADAFPGVLPRPKHYLEAGAPLELAAVNEIITITIHGDDRVLHTAAADLSQRITSMGGRTQLVERNGRIQIAAKADWPTDVALTFSAPEHEQGYGLLVTQDGESRAQSISIVGTDAVGAYYGVQTLVQLLDGSSSEGIFVRHAKITDWPSFTFRAFKSQCWQYDDNRRLAKWAPRFKFNVFASCYTDSIDWRSPPLEYESMLSEICETASSGGAIQILQLGNPYVNKDRPIQAGSEQDALALFAFFERSLAAGSRAIMLCLDDFAVMTEEDRSTFPTLASANASIVNQLHTSIQQKYPGTVLMVCPPPYWLNAHQREEYAWAHDYLRDFCAAIPDEVIIVWTGHEVNTICHRLEDINAYQGLIGSGRSLMLWDNTIKFPPGWSNVFRVNAFASECSDFSASAWPNLDEHVDGRAIINTYGPAELSKIALLTATDYLWNPEHYDAKDALKRAQYWFDEDDHELGQLVWRFANVLHQGVLDQRTAFMKKPDRQKLEDARRSVLELQQGFQGLKPRASAELLADLEPYVRRHVDAMPILEEIEAGFSMRKSSPEEGVRRLEHAASELRSLVERVSRAGPTQPANGCVKLVLEQKAINTIERWIRQSKGTAAPDR